MQNGLPRRVCPAAWYVVTELSRFDMTTYELCQCSFSLLLFPIFDDIQQKEVGGNDDLHPVEVIITACPDVNWAAKEGMPSGIVSLYHDLSYYGVDWPSYSHG
jgi:hypothetical protein